MKKIGVLFAGICFLIDSFNGFAQAPNVNWSTHDSVFKEPYIDKDEWRDVPVRHRYVHGGFKGTDTRFSVYFPSKEKYKGRFFQYITPVPDSETLSQGATGEEDKIGFSISNGAYFIETNGGGNDAKAAFFCYSTGITPVSIELIQL